MPFMGRDPVPPPPEEAARPLSVSELNVRVKTLLERTLPSVWVEGAISKPTLATSGHLYFALQDATSRVDGIMFANRARLLRFKVVEGLQVRARGGVTLYAPGGRYQLNVLDLEPAGVGARELQLQKLRERLRGEGLLDADRKRPIPFMPRTIALVTSPTGAAIRDLVHVILRRFPPARLLIVPVRVQGEGAAEEIATGLRLASLIDDVDVIIAGRGGGSAEDLWAFNEEPVARALFASRVPVISAVGHEIDTTLADEVADLRAATPSQAGELAVPVFADLTASLRDSAKRLDAGIRARAIGARREVTVLGERPGLTRFRDRFDERRQTLDDAAAALGEALRARVQKARETLTTARRVLDAHRPVKVVQGVRARLVSVGARLDAAVRPRLDLARAAVARREGALSALNPVAVLGRGFSITWIERGGVRRAVRDSGELGSGETLHTTFGSGDDAASRVLGSEPRSAPTPDPRPPGPAGDGTGPSR